MPPLIFRLVALLVAFGGFATAAFPRQMTRYRMRRMGGGEAASIEPSGMRLLFARVTGAVVGVIGLLMALGGGSLLV